MFDFREGLDPEKAVYKDDSYDWVSVLKYIGFLLFAYCWGMGWFCLFFWLYGTYQRVTFWVFIGIFLAHIISIVIVGAINIQKNKTRKINKRKAKEEKEEQMKRIIEQKRKRKPNVTKQGGNDYMNHRQTPNLDDEPDILKSDNILIEEYNNSE